MIASVGYLATRAVTAALTLAGISVVIFAVIALAPGDPFTDLAASGAVSPEILQDLRARAGLDEPVLVQYLRWASALMQGHWGYSQSAKVEVQTLIWQRLPTTLFVMGTSYLLALLIAVPIGVISAVRQYSWLDHLITLLTFLGNALPTFFIGMLFILVLGYQLRLLPTIYASTADPSQSGLRGQVLAGAIMPIAVLALAEATQIARYVRASMLEVIRLDYVTTARAKGLSEWLVLRRHALRTALVPVVTILALQIPHVFTGAIVTEQIFRIPGIGSLLIASMLAKDTPVVMAIVFGYAILAVLSNLVADVLYGILDPRIRAGS
ncbi:MAG: ABC transporter permease [Chloroflexota bacterium]